jgi:hypothetical protein
MSAGPRTGRDLPGGRRWSARSDEQLPIDWSVDSADGLLQGPLDLGFLCGRRLALTLSEGQSALLLGNGRVQAVYPPGRHQLEIGVGEDGIDPAWRLLFLAPGAGLALRWTAESPLRCGPGNGLELIGSGRLEIADPCAFHDAFLAGVDAPDTAFTLSLIDRLVQGAVAERLASAAPGSVPCSPTEAQARLTGLGPTDLADELAPCGLSCRELAVYTLNPPVDQDRSRWSTPVLDAEPVPMSGHSEDLRRH